MPNLAKITHEVVLQRSVEIGKPSGGGRAFDAGAGWGLGLKGLSFPHDESWAYLAIFGARFGWSWRW